MGARELQRDPGGRRGSVRGHPHMRMHVCVYLCAHGGGQGHVYEHTCNCVIYVCVLACLDSCLHVHMCARMALGFKHTHAWDVGCVFVCMCVCPCRSPGSKQLHPHSQHVPLAASRWPLKTMCWALGKGASSVPLALSFQSESLR